MTRISTVFVFLFFTAYASAQNKLQVWLSDPAKTIHFQEQTAQSFSAAKSSKPAISINAKKKFQEIDGFGFALTGGSAQHIVRMSAAARAALLKELFDTTGNNIGISYLRISIGASDLNEKVFSYNDLPAGETDPELKKFDLGPDKEDVIPVLKEILAINPHIKIMGSPWSPPSWMKTNNDSRGGQLKYEFYDSYALYFVKYIQAMKEHGIRIDAITIQNEPLHPGNNPSLLMVAPDQALFIKKHLGPAFEKVGIDAKIVLYDHNADRPDYPILILNDPEARKYIDGSAFHLYGGTIDALTDVHEAHPDKSLYFTEQWMNGRDGSLQANLGWHMKNLIIGAPRNWCRNVIEWNLAADPQFRPYTDRGGCDVCLGAVTIDKDSVTRNSGYYIVAHASKFVRPGSVRIATTDIKDLANVAFKTPSGKTVLIVLNDSKSTAEFNITEGAKTATVSLAAGSAATYVW